MRIFLKLWIATAFRVGAPVSRGRALGAWRDERVDANGEVVADGIGIRRNNKVPLPFETSSDLVSTRNASALVLEPQGDVKGGVVYLHGFSQQPKNYLSTLRAMAAAGLRVVAPSTWLLDTAWPWVDVETAPKNPFAAAAKLQTAVIIDGMRAAKYLEDAGVEDISLAGHSMGGACALVIPSLVDTKFRAVCCMSPAAATSAETELNPYLAGNPEDYPKLFNAYKSKPKIVLVTAAKDRIVKPASVVDVFDAAPPESSAHSAIQTGSHIGFEDSLVVRIPIGNRKIRLFSGLSSLIYAGDAFESFLGDLDLQLDVTKIIVDHILAATMGSTDLADDVHLDKPVTDWDAVYKLDTTASDLAAVLSNPLQSPAAAV